MNSGKENFEELSSKAVFRKLALEQRKNMPLSEVSEKSSNIVNRILAIDSYKNAKCIYAYISTRNEVDLSGLIEAAWAAGKRVAVPRVFGQDMNFYYIESFNDLAKGNFGILEPTDSAVQAEERDALMLIPGVAYDIKGNRIGYGGGYYDRYLAGEHKHYIIAPAYESQIADSIVSEEHDIKVNGIVSELRNILFKPE